MRNGVAILLCVCSLALTVHAGDPISATNYRELQVEGSFDPGLDYFNVYFLSDEEIAQAARVLYDWSDEGSCWAVNRVWGAPGDPAVAKVDEMFKQMGDEVYHRPLETFKELIKPWRPDELGFRSMAEWHGIELAMSEEDLKSFTVGGPGHGVYLVK